MLDINNSLEHFDKHGDLLLTRDDPVSVLQSMEVVHELLYRNPEGLKQTCVLKELIGNLGNNILPVISQLCRGSDG